MSSVEITAVGRYKLAALHRLVDKYGSQAAAAKVLGVGHIAFSRWVNMRDCPRRETWKAERFEALDERLVAETGLTIDLIWPAELREAIDREAIPKTFANTQAVQVRALEHYGGRTAQRLQYHGDPVNQLVVEERTESVQQLLKEMRRCEEISPRDYQVIIHRFGLDGEGPKTLGEVGKLLSIGRVRVQQIEAKVIRKLQQPQWASRLVEFADE